MEEFEGRTEERCYWMEVNRRTGEMEEFGEKEKRPRKEKDDWGGRKWEVKIGDRREEVGG